MSIRDEYLNKMISRMSSANYLVFINGIPEIYNGSYVYARVVRTGKVPVVEFYTLYRVEGKNFQSTPARLMNAIMEDVTSGKLFEWDFTNWLSTNFRSDYCGVRVNENLKAIFLESPIYNAFRTAMSGRYNLNMEFQAVTNEGTKLGPTQLPAVLNQFRLNGFNSLLSLEKTNIGRKISGITPGLYKKESAFTLAGVRIKELYNPIFDDLILYSQLSRTTLISDMLRRSITNERLGVSISYLSNEHICRGFGIKELVPFNYSFLIKMIAGNSAVLPPNIIPVTFPNKDLPVYRLHSPTPDMDKVISVREYQQSSESTREMYVDTNARRAYILANSQFFLSRGFRKINDLLPIMDEAELI